MLLKLVSRQPKQIKSTYLKPSHIFAAYSLFSSGVSSVMYLISLSFQQFYGPIRETTGDFLVSA
jgi:hypothetical protein